jgi:hypothetical protein
MTTTERESHSLAAEAISVVGGWLRRYRVLNGPDGTLDDLPISARRRSKDAGELSCTLRALWLDEAALRDAEPASLRDMELVCSLCAHKRQCHDELATGTAASNYVEYCENSRAIDTLIFKS